MRGMRIFLRGTLTSSTITYDSRKELCARIVSEVSRQTSKQASQPASRASQRCNAADKADIHFNCGDRPFGTTTKPSPLAASPGAASRSLLCSLTHSPGSRAASARPSLPSAMCYRYIDGHSRLMILMEQTSFAVELASDLSASGQASRQAGRQAGRQASERNLAPITSVVFGARS